MDARAARLIRFRPDPAAPTLRRRAVAPGEGGDVIAYLLIGGVGFFMLVLTWFMGELFDIGHDVAGWFGDHLGEIHVDGHEIGLGHGEAPGGEVAPSPFSSRVIFTFMTAFGGGGAIGSLLKLPVATNVLVALGSGLVMGAVTYAFARMLYQQAGSSTFDPATALGHEGRVEIGIPSQGTGQVTVAAGGGNQTLLARSRSGAAIDAGTAVRVVEAQGNLLVVEPVTSARSSGSSPAS